MNKKVCRNPLGFGKRANLFWWGLTGVGVVSCEGFGVAEVAVCVGDDVGLMEVVGDGLGFVVVGEVGGDINIWLDSIVGTGVGTAVGTGVGSIVGTAVGTGVGT